jgi:N-carbamoyl-L-amino-acid hydrolase
MARTTPTGMIFVPSAGGRSHSPADLTLHANIVNGTNVLLGTMVRLASS